MRRSTGLLAASATTLTFLGGVAFAVPAHASATEHVPASIDATGNSDVTTALQTWLDSVPDDSTLVFPAGAEYRIEGTLHVKNKNHWVIEGNEALFFATTTGNRTRSQWSFEAGSDITVRDVVVKGANPYAGTGDAAYVESLEAQHAFNVFSVQGMDIDHVSASDVYGDFVYIGLQAGGLARNIHVHDSVFTRNGRQGISVTGADGVLIDHNVISETRRSTFDIEPNGPGWSVANVTIRDNTIGAGRLAFLADAGSGPVSNITVSNNQLTRNLTVYVGDSQKLLDRTGFHILNNVATVQWGGPSGMGALRFLGASNIDVRDNVIPIQKGRGDYGVEATNACDVTVESNDFRGAPPLTFQPAADCTAAPSPTPTVAPTFQPTPAPTTQPTVAPTTQPTVAPTSQPTVAPTIQPTIAPTTTHPAPTPPADGGGNGGGIGGDGSGGGAGAGQPGDSAWTPPAAHDRVIPRHGLTMSLNSMVKHAARIMAAHHKALAALHIEAARKATAKVNAHPAKAPTAAKHSTVTAHSAGAVKVAAAPKAIPASAAALELAAQPRDLSTRQLTGLAMLALGGLIALCLGGELALRRR